MRYTIDSGVCRKLAHGSSVDDEGRDSDVSVRGNDEEVCVCVCVCVCVWVGGCVGGCG